MSAFTDASLIFLISQPRAGSTMVQRVLSGHPEVHTTAEPWLMLHPVYGLRATGHEAEYGARIAYRAVQDFLSTLPEKDDIYWQAVQRMALHLYGTACREAGKSYFLDKTPRYFFIIPELAKIFPQARFVILLRNPLAVLSSILRTWVNGEWIRLQRHYDNLLTAPRLLAEGIRLLGERAYTIHYETFVQEAEAQTAALCAWLGLDFTPEMLDYGERPSLRGRYGDPKGIQQYRRPTAVSNERWVQLGAQRQTRHLAKAYLDTLGPALIAELGYDYHRLRQKLLSTACRQSSIVAPWNQILVPNPGKGRKLFLVFIELLQKRRLLHAAQQAARVCTGRF